MRKLVQIFFICLMAATAVTIPAEGRQVTIVADESKLWIEGRSNVNQFQCFANQYTSDIETTGNADTLADTGLDVEIDIFVRSFDCGRSRMNRDLQDALKVREHEAIRFRYTDTKNVQYNPDDDTYTLTVEGVLIVAGTERTILFDLDGKLVNNTIKASGNTTLEMTEFNIEPPTALMGLVKVDGTLQVHFDLTAKFEDE